MKTSILKQPALFICGLVFTILGSIFTVLGGVFAILLDELKNSADNAQDIIALPISFLSLGAGFLCAGIILFLVRHCMFKKIEKLKADGYYIMATISHVTLDSTVRINQRNPYYLECIYTEPSSGLKHSFRSDRFFTYEGTLEGQEVKVYLDRNKPGKYTPYHVELSPLIQDIILH